MSSRIQQPFGIPPKFDQAIMSLVSYQDLKNIPPIIFRRINQIILLERRIKENGRRISAEQAMDEACEKIETRMGVSRKEIKARLEAHPSTYNPVQ